MQVGYLEIVTLRWTRSAPLQRPTVSLLASRSLLVGRSSPPGRRSLGIRAAAR